ncbi:hypothetical protein [Alsobacter sp. R-9]
MPRQNLMAALATATLLAFNTPTFAQGTGPNGGLLSSDKSHAVELIVKPAEITVYLIDSGKVDVPTGATVRVVVQDGTRNETVPLTVDGNRLTGKLAAPLNKGARVVVTGKDSHGHTLQGRFVIP